jgi:hypothetical protein
MKTFLSSLIILLVSFNQVLSQEQLLFKLDKPIEGFNRSGTSIFYRKKTKGPKTSSLPARIEVTDVADGFIIRNDFNLKKFNFKGEKIWDVNLNEEFKLFHLPYMFTVGDEKMTYIFEMQTNPFKAKNVKVSSISPEGKLSEKVFESDLNRFRPGKLADGIEHTINPYVSDGKFKILAKSGDKKADIIQYRLYEFDQAKGSFNSTELDLPTNEYEYKEAEDRTDALNKPFLWNYLTSKDGTDVFFKAYFKDIKKDKAFEPIIKLVEVKGTSISPVREIAFNPVIANDDRKFSFPSVLYNKKENAIFLVGHMEIDKRRINGLYLMKYDYQSLENIYRHEHHFDDILKPNIETELKPHYKIPEQVHSTYPLNFRAADVLFSKADQLNLRIVTNYNLRTMTFFELGFNQNGEHIQTDLTEYSTNISLLDFVIPTPMAYERVWAKEQTHKNTSWSYINSNLTDDKDLVTLWYPLKNSADGKIVKINQETGSYYLVSF